MVSWRLFVGSAGLFGALGVMSGAFGAHALRDVLPTAALETWRTAVLYHLIHALLLLVLGLWCRSRLVSGNLLPISLKIAGWALMVGIVLFSGSLYALAMGGPVALGPITPIGGVALIFGWLCVMVSAFSEETAS